MGTFSRAMLSMFELTLANWPPICRLLSEKWSEWFMLLAMLHKLSIGFAVIGVINGVLMQETFKVANSDDGIMERQKKRAGRLHREKMKKLFSVGDANVDLKVDKDEFECLVREPYVKSWLHAMDL